MKRTGRDEVPDTTGELFEPAPAGTAGHHKRLRKRLLSGGSDALGDHEVVEYLLMTAIPRRDTKPLAKALIARFGSLAGVLNADPRALALHPGKAIPAPLRSRLWRSRRGAWPRRGSPKRRCSPRGRR